MVVEFEKQTTNPEREADIQRLALGPFTGSTFPDRVVNFKKPAGRAAIDRIDWVKPGSEVHFPDPMEVGDPIIGDAVEHIRYALKMPDGSLVVKIYRLDKDDGDSIPLATVNFTKAPNGEYLPRGYSEVTTDGGALPPKSVTVGEKAPASLGEGEDAIIESVSVVTATYYGSGDLHGLRDSTVVALNGSHGVYGTEEFFNIPNNQVDGEDKITRILRTIDGDSK